PRCSSGQESRSARPAPPAPIAGHAGRGALLAGGAATQARRARLLAGAVVAVDRAPLDRLVDRLHQRAVLDVDRGAVATGDRVLETAEVGLDLGRVAAVLQPLTLGAEDALLL